VAHGVSPEFKPQHCKKKKNYAKFLVSKTYLMFAEINVGK
jgi:hypothetical protein